MKKDIATDIIEDNEMECLFDKEHRDSMHDADVGELGCKFASMHAIMDEYNMSREKDLELYDMAYNPAAYWDTRILMRARRLGITLPKTYGPIVEEMGGEMYLLTDLFFGCKNHEDRIAHLERNARIRDSRLWPAVKKLLFEEYQIEY